MSESPQACPEALDGLKELLEHPQVEHAVKTILQREYPPGDELYAVFVNHSWSVAHWSRILAQQVKADWLFVWEAAWLHDIGIKYTRAPGIHCHGSEHYLSHGVIGRKICEEMGLTEHGLVCERHVGTGFTAEEIAENELPLPVRDMLNLTVEQRIVCYVDQFFSKSTPRPLTIDEVETRVARHGVLPLQRFHQFKKEFVSFVPGIKKADSPTHPA